MRVVFLGIIRREARQILELRHLVAPHECQAGRRVATKLHSERPARLVGYANGITAGESNDPAFRRYAAFGISLAASIFVPAGTR